MKIEVEEASGNAAFWRVDHHMAGIGNLSVAQFHSHGIDVFDVRACSGVENAYYPQHIVTLIRRPFIFNANWDGHKFQRPWEDGSVVFIPANSSLSHLASQPYDEVVIRLSEDVFQQASREHVDYSQINFAMQDVTSPTTWGYGYGLAKAVMDESYRAWPLLIESASIVLALSVIKKLAPGASQAFGEVNCGLGSVRRSRVLEFIDDNLHRQISLSELANVASLSHYHFARQFKNRMGVTPLQYLAQRRVDNAKKMLRSTSMGLAEIAIACGFASQSHFTTVFKKMMGSTPGAYRYMAT